MSVKFVEEDAIQDYFENLAKAHKEIAHSNERKAFHFIADKYDLDEFDKAIKSCVKFPSLLLDSIEGSLDDNDSANYTDQINFAFSILIKAKGRLEIREARKKAKRIGLEIITRMRADKNKGKLFNNPLINMQIKSNYEPIGKIDPDLFGYIFTVSIICPFSFSPNSTTWSDL